MDRHADQALVLTRKELYERVWTLAMWKLAPSLGLSDRGMHKLCKRHNIPTPPLGYWARKEHGKAPRKPALPRCDDPQLLEIKFFPNTPKRNFEIELERATDVAPEERIAVPATLDSSHPLVAETQQALTGAGTDEDGMHTLNRS